MSYSLDTVILDTKSNGKPKSAIVLCHGYAGNGKNIALLANYWRDFLPDTMSPASIELIRQLKASHDPNNVFGIRNNVLAD